MHAPPKFYHGLTEEQFATVGKICMNWGAADNFCGWSLQRLYDIGKDNAIELIYAVDLRKKIDFLVRFLKRATLSDDAAALIRELNSVHGMWSQDRNIVAHGFGKKASDGVPHISYAKKQTMTATENLAPFLDRSEYVLELVIRLDTILAGGDQAIFGPLRQRPS